MRFLLLFLAFSPLSASAQDGPAPVVAGRPPLPVRCAAPLADYDKIVRRLAQNMAESAYPGPKSAKLLATEQKNLISLGEITDLSGCGGRPLPLSPGPYLLAAMRCERARRAPKAPASPPACDMARWKPFTE